MADISYPNLLPSPLITVKEKERDLLLRTTMDSGYTQVRRRFTKVPVDFTIKFKMTFDELDHFYAWYKDGLTDGMSWFDIELPVGQGLQVQHECRFKDTPSVNLEGTCWNVNCKIEAVEIKKSYTYDETTNSFFDSIGGFDEASNFYNSLNTFTNTTLPSLSGIVD